MSSVTLDNACIWLGIRTTDRAHRGEVWRPREHPRWLREVNWVRKSGNPPYNQQHVDDHPARSKGR
jgi:hypothetical protein